MSSGPGSANAGGVRCQMCGQANPPQARYCLSCGTRLPVAATTPEAEAAAFEDALADVVVDAPAPPPPGTAPPPWSAPTAGSPPATDAGAASANPPPATDAGNGSASGAWGSPTGAEPGNPSQPADGTWTNTGGTYAPGNAAGWPTPADVRHPRRWPWIVLIIVGVIFLCCCSLMGVGFVSNQTASVTPMVSPFA